MYFRCVSNLTLKWRRWFPYLNLFLLVWFFHYLPNLNLVFNAYFKYFLHLPYTTCNLFIDLVSRFVFRRISDKRRTNTSGCKLKEANEFYFGFFLVWKSDIQNDICHSYREQTQGHSRIYRSWSRISWNIENVNCLCDDAIERERSFTSEVRTLIGEFF